MEIDHEMNLVLFKSHTNVEDDDTAYNYLNQSNWDVEKAVQIYFNEMDELEKMNPDIIKKKSSSKIGGVGVNNKNSSEKVSNRNNNGKDFHDELMSILGLPKEKSFETVSNFQNYFLNFFNF